MTCTEIVTDLSLLRVLQILTKSLLPLPDKYYGLSDVELRHRQRCALFCL